ncbi:hypothetical protein [Streptosporangium sp. NPDC049046]|uniref:hypothetical protein n=1 Tax=unclassified Streptosporangium TaxID=2632669 RepID=UPI0034318FDC
MAEKDALPSEVTVYLRHLSGLWPGRKVPVFALHRVEPGEMRDWDSVELTLLVEEGRRQLDRQLSDLEQIRGRAQFLFPTALALLLVVLASVQTITAAPTPWSFVVWCVSITSTMLGLLGSAAVTVVRKEIGTIDSTRLSRQSPPILPILALSYARTVRIGENTVATHITVFRDAVLLVLLGVITQGFAWLLAVF